MQKVCTRTNHQRIAGGETRFFCGGGGLWCLKTPEKKLKTLPNTNLDLAVLFCQGKKKVMLENKSKTA
jgi:hypothetical protein